MKKMAADQKNRLYPSSEERQRRRSQEALVAAHRIESLLAANNPDEPLSVEELQIISNLNLGGFGAIDAFGHAYLRALRQVVPKVAFPLSDIRDTRRDKHGKPVRQRRGRPSALALHNRTLARCGLYRGILLAAVELSLTARTEAAGERLAFRREQREWIAVADRLRASNAPDLAAQLEARNQNKSIAHRQMGQLRRATVKSRTDAFMEDVRANLVRFTKLRG
jgi:hypothetical protein